MNTRIVVIIGIMSMLSSGCMGYALRSPRTPATTILEPRMLGRWQGVDAPRSRSIFDDRFWDTSGEWLIEGAPDSSIRAIQRQGEDVNVYAGSVFRVGDDLFFDLTPDSLESTKCQLFPAIPCHGFARLRFDGDTMTVGYLRSEWLETAAKERKLPRAAGLVMTEEDDGLLTGEAPEIGAVLTIAAADPRAFSTGKLVRKR